MRRCVWLALAAACWVVVGGPRPASAQEASEAQTPQTIELTIGAAAEPSPALRYELLPPQRLRRPGNAAISYYRAGLTVQSVPEVIVKEEAKWYADFGSDAYRKAPRDRLLAWIDEHRPAIAELRIAAYRERCDWDLRLQDLRGTESVTVLLDEFQQMRRIIRPLNQQARLEIEAGRFDEAIESLRVGYQAARDVGQNPNLICGLIGIAFAEQFHQSLEAWIDAPDSPNLYWSLAAMPRPFVSLRDALEMERSFPERMFPFLVDAETAERTPEEWRRLYVEALEQLEVARSGGRSGRPSWQTQAAVMALAAGSYTKAKRELIEAGLDRERVERMPVGQVLAVHVSRSTRRISDQMVKATNLPYPQALVWQEKIVREMTSSDGAGRAFGGELLPVAQLLLPSTALVVRAEARQERNRAALQTIEAIRMHLAASGGKLPDTLDQIVVCPVPLNPATGQPFPYERNGEQAVLEVPGLAGDPAQTAKRYRLRVAAK